jgi:hypothetical protein
MRYTPELLILAGLVLFMAGLFVGADLMDRRWRRR